MAWLPPHPLVLLHKPLPSVSFHYFFYYSSVALYLQHIAKKNVFVFMAVPFNQELFSFSQLKSKVGNFLAKAAALRITLNIDGVTVVLNHTLTHHTQAFS